MKLLVRLYVVLSMHAVAMKSCLHGGTTESIKLLASSFADSQMKEGDEVIVSVMEHHSNIVPWQLQAARKGIVRESEFP